MSNGLPDDVTGILDRLNAGDRAAVTTLLPAVYADLRRLADQFFRRERRDHTLQPTALVHEAYLRLMESPEGQWASREHFFRAAAVVMRHILVNHARMKGSIKRGGGREQASIDDALAVFEERAVDLVALDEAMTRLAALDPRPAQVVELRFFAGLSVRETAEVLGIAERTVEGDWAMARAWLLREITRE